VLAGECTQTLPSTRKWGQKPPPSCALGGVSDKSGRALAHCCPHSYGCIGHKSSRCWMMPWQCWPFYGNCDIKKNHSGLFLIVDFLHASTTHYYSTDSYVHVGKCVGNRSRQHDADSQKNGRHNRISPTCRDDISDMSADRHICRHCQPRLSPQLVGSDCVLRSLDSEMSAIVVVAALTLAS
jgi:hypothetical protein